MSIIDIVDQLNLFHHSLGLGRWSTSPSPFQDRRGSEACCSRRWPQAWCLPRSYPRVSRVMANQRQTAGSCNLILGGPENQTSCVYFGISLCALECLISHVYIKLLLKVTAFWERKNSKCHPTFVPDCMLNCLTRVGSRSLKKSCAHIYEGDTIATIFFRTHHDPCHLPDLKETYRETNC